MHKNYSKFKIKLAKSQNPVIKFFINCKFEFLCWFWYEKCRKNNQIPSRLLKQEFRKYANCIWHHDNRRNVLIQWKTLLTSSFKLISNNLINSTSNDSPMVFVVVRNEFERMKVFFKHYRMLGVEQFVVLDNGSDDGTLELSIRQKGTKVYQILDTFETNKKVGWIEKLLIINGKDRWCIVADSDELLDYYDSEIYTLKELINTGYSNGYKRIEGVLLDMYSKGSLFSDSKSFAKEFRYFDKNSYIVSHTEDSKNTTNVIVYGGPRDRVLGGERFLCKQAVFFFERNNIYINCHHIYPITSSKSIPCWYVLKHYKFLKKDTVEYSRRVQEKNFFNSSIEYKIIEQSDCYTRTFFYEDSQEYIDSHSLECLPFLEKIPW